MSATDEELQYVHESGMDHVTYILIMFRYAFYDLVLFPFSPCSLPSGPPPRLRHLRPPDKAKYSIAFLLYAHIVFLITLYATSGRNAPDAAPMKDTSSGAIELTATPTTRRGGGWYSRVRSEEPMHVIGNEEDEEED